MRNYDLNLLRDLLSGEEFPNNYAEEMFLKVYEKSLDGELLLNIIIDLKNDFDTLERLEYQFVLLGYGLGQYDGVEAKNGLDLKKINKDDNEPVH